MRQSFDELRQRVDDLIEDREKMRDRVDELTEALYKIKEWSEAYPLAVFPEPDWAEARALLEAGGITIDAVSGTIIRRVLMRVGNIAREALEDSST
jgi:hypothetical protein